MEIVAEIGINHNGNSETARQLMKMAKDCGCDFVKFQKRTLDIVYTKDFLDSPRESPWGKTQRDQKSALEFDRAGYEEIDRYAKEIGLPWFASCWDLESLAFVERFNPPLNKIASPMLTNERFIKYVASLGRKTLISTGMSDWGPILRAIEIFTKEKCPFALLHCVSEYPCPDDHVNLRMILELKTKFTGIPIGYSNHSPGIESCVGAAYLGAEWLEVHVTLDRSMYGSDQAASLERRGLELVCKYARNAKTIIGDGVKVILPGEKTNAGKLRYWEESHV